MNRKHSQETPDENLYDQKKEALAAQMLSVEIIEIRIIGQRAKLLLAIYIIHII